MRSDVKLLRGILVVVVAATAFAHRAGAEEGGAAAAAALAASARVYYDEGKLDQALELFEKAYSLDPDKSLQVNIARIYDKKGDLARAQTEYEKLLKAPLDAAVKAKVEAWLAAVLEKFTGFLVLRVEPAGASVLVDGQAVVLSKEGGLELKTGRHQVVVRQDGFLDETRDVDVVSGAKVGVDVRLRSRLGKVKLDCACNGAQITVDGVSVGVVPLKHPLQLEPGAHLVELVASGFNKASRNLKVVSGEEILLSMKMESVVAKAPTPPVPAAVPAVPVAKASPPKETRKLGDAVIAKPATVKKASAWPWVTFGTGVVALATGGVLTWASSSQRAKVTGAATSSDGQTLLMTMEQAKKYQDNANRYQTAAVAMYAVGGAAALGGLIWGIVDLVRRPAARAEYSGQKKTVIVGASPWPSGAVVTVNVTGW
jgi:tetratricopeptide (TPR) repeat protein